MAKDSKQKKHFFKDFKAELKKVVWPTPKQLVNNTVAVVVIVIITSAIVFVLDLVFDLMNSYGIDKLKTQLKSNTINVVDTENNVVDENVTENNQENQTLNSDEATK